MRWLDAAHSLQLGVLLGCEIDIILLPPAPGADATLKLCHVLRRASLCKRTQAVQRGEVIVPRLCAYGRFAMSLDEVNPPQRFVVVEVHQDARHKQDSTAKVDS
jgi:hypothetical protein